MNNGYRWVVRNHEVLLVSPKDRVLDTINYLPTTDKLYKRGGAPGAFVSLAGAVRSAEEEHVPMNNSVNRTEIVGLL